MLHTISNVLFSLNLTPAYLLILGALIGYFRHQHTGKKVPGILSIPKDLTKSTDSNKLWTLLYMVCLPLAWLVNLVVHAVYALTWLINTVGIAVHWVATKAYWVWRQLVLGLAGFSFYTVWHYLVIWPYKLFSVLLSSFVRSFNWSANRSTYRTVFYATLLASSGYVLNDIIDLKVISFDQITLVLGVLWLLDALGVHMSTALGVSSKAMRPTYQVLGLTAIIVFALKALAQKYGFIDSIAGVSGGVVLGVSIATWIYGLVIMAAVVQFVSLIVPAYLTEDGAYDWMQSFRKAFSSRWLKSIGSIVLFVIAYNTLGQWVYTNYRAIANEGYSEFYQSVGEKETANWEELATTTAETAMIGASDSIDSEAYGDALGEIRSLTASVNFLQSIPQDLREAVYMPVSMPFEASDEDVLAAEGVVANHDSMVDAKEADLDAAIADAQTELQAQTDIMNRIRGSEITASEDGSVDPGTRMSFGIERDDDATKISWRIVNNDGDTIKRSTRSELTHRFNTPGSFTVAASQTNDCGKGDWHTYQVTVNTPSVPGLTMGNIRGSSDVCVGDERSYSAPRGMDIYVWQVPSGAELLDEKDNTIKVKWGKSSGEIHVYGELDGQGATADAFYVTVTGAPGTAISSGDKTPDAVEEEVVSSRMYYPVLMAEAAASVEVAQAALDMSEVDKASFMAWASNENVKYVAQVNDLKSRQSMNTAHWLMGILGKALFLIVSSAVFAILLNFMVLWLATYFGRVYTMDQDGDTYFKSTLGDYRANYEGFPYAGIFLVIAILFLAQLAGSDLDAGAWSKLEDSSAWPMIMDYLK